MEIVNTILIVVLVIAWVLIMLQAMRYRRAVKTWIAPALVQERLDEGEDILILDVRTEEEFRKEGHIKGAVNLPLRELGTRLTRNREELRKFNDTAVIIVCKVGGRSTSALWPLQRAGLKQARIMQGGMHRWIAQGLPIVKG